MVLWDGQLNWLTSNQTDKRGKKRKTQINNISNKKGDITTDSITIRENNILDNLISINSATFRWNDKFLERHRLQSLLRKK